MDGQPAKYFVTRKDGRLRCTLCPRGCTLRDGQAGLCAVRRNQGGTMVLSTYGQSTGFCIDPIEKKPLNHFYPGTSVLSFGTAGCNLCCRFCQNWKLSTARPEELRSERATAQQIAKRAKDLGCTSVAYTYNDPVVFFEYAVDTARACRDQGIKNVAVTAGYLSPPAAEEFFACMDAANVDLKAFSDAFYRRMCSARLQPVLDTLLYLRRSTSVWLELTTLLISAPPLRLPSRPPAAGRAPDQRRGPRKGPNHRQAQRAPARLHRQRPRPQGLQHLLRRLQEPPDRARLVPARPLRPGRGQPLREMRSCLRGTFR